MNDKVNDYYSSIDKNVLNDLSKNNNLKNLINLSIKSDIYIFNKKKKIYELKTKEQLLKECNQYKQKELKKTSSILSNLAKINSLNELNKNKIKTINNNLEENINNIDEFITCINNINKDDKEDKEDKEDKDNYIECYSNS